MIFFILVLCINKNRASINGINDPISFYNNDDESGFPINRDKSFDLKEFIPEDIESSQHNAWSRLFHSETSQPRITNRSRYPSRLHSHSSPNGRMYIIPFDKRTIPIELQKALYAHGIVGR
ncbi:unnamed protein product [Rotaria sp. Silwood1]|nr:unnamed protein product [Rotaria sp. Silwood1]CAF3408641.1 unnamed protein product [Rotaria sp. Silwood1]CAF3420229.1 unnamed protein product [Rotaria sp. Silwood1]CAF3436028.1 unnamed protein product [Rotaria sp. Silwood1]CAF4925484.1 unnamed protein product [Rotaria sp. Silwood1]